MTSLLSVTNLCVSSEKNKFILKDINIEAYAGDCIVITGPNGAGKTTLLKTINGLIKYSYGKIKIFNSTINNKTKSMTGYIPQTNFYDKNIPISVKEILTVGLSAKYGIFKKLEEKENSLIEETAQKLGISHLLEKPAGHISGGEMQKVSIARILLQEARLILMDEPMSNLDQKSQSDISDITDLICSKKKTAVLTVVHNISQIPKSCNKIAVMKNGQIIKFDRKEKIFDSDFFKTLYGQQWK